MAKSAYLSVGRYQDAERRRSYRAELRDLSAMIIAGGEVDFEESEIARLLGQREDVEEASAAVWPAVFRFFFPGLLFLVGLCLLYFVIRFLRGGG